jgi:hypothetical protein
MAGTRSRAGRFSFAAHLWDGEEAGLDAVL